MFRSLLIKGVMLAAAIAAVLWIGWPAPDDGPPPSGSDQPTIGPAPAGAPVSDTSAVKAVAKVNLNRAGVDELQMLPGVGPVLAQRVVEWRKAHGRYRTVDDLQEVKGIGKKRLERIRPLVTV
jgi:competence protein ComEA